MDDVSYQYKAIERERLLPPNLPRQYSYEHFPVVCPTCEGKGEIEEDSSGMVTFVPVKDKRLRPAWTKLKIAVLLFFILIVGGFSTYFLYPRNVQIFITANEVKDFDFNRKIPWMLYGFEVNIDNKNFFPITLNYVSMQLFYVQRLVSTDNVHHKIKVGIRRTLKFPVTMNISYEGDTAKYVKQECYKDRYYFAQLLKEFSESFDMFIDRWCISQAPTVFCSFLSEIGNARAFGEISYWMNTERVESRDEYFYTDCSSMVFPLPTKLTTATTTSTTSSTLNVSTTAIPYHIITAIPRHTTISSSNNQQDHKNTSLIY